MSSSVAGKTAVLQNIHGTMEFLRKYPPFNQMDSAQLAYLVEHCQLRFYGAGESIIKPTDAITAAIMTDTLLTIPTAVMMESSEKTRSITTICKMIEKKVASTAFDSAPSSPSSN